MSWSRDGTGIVTEFEFRLHPPGLIVLAGLACSSDPAEDEQMIAA